MSCTAPATCASFLRTSRLCAFSVRLLRDACIASPPARPLAGSAPPPPPSTSSSWQRNSACRRSSGACSPGGMPYSSAVSAGSMSTWNSYLSKLPSTRQSKLGARVPAAFKSSTPEWKVWAR
eukprot:scaffold12691_cov108-Isochrysis_galbana.AAC.13